MRANNTRRALAALSAIAVAIGLAISAAPAAHADERDDAFLLALRRLGIRPLGDDPAGRAGLVTWAHWACDQMDQGADPQHVVNWLSGFNQADNADFGATDAMFLREAAHYYCPVHEEKAAVIARRGQPR